MWWNYDIDEHNFKCLYWYPFFINATINEIYRNEFPDTYVKWFKYAFGNNFLLMDGNVCSYHVLLATNYFKVKGIQLDGAACIFSRFKSGRKYAGLTGMLICITVKHFVLSKSFKSLFIVSYAIYFMAGTLRHSNMQHRKLL